MRTRLIGDGQYRYIIKFIHKKAAAMAAAASPRHGRGRSVRPQPWRGCGTAASAGRLRHTSPWPCVFFTIDHRIDFVSEWLGVSTVMRSRLDASARRCDDA